ncbi:hypothetical protein ACFSTD_13720 [Novosphingobium colocasiae]
MRQAMVEARQRIFMIGWDFDSRILLSSGRRWWQLPRKGRFPARLGSFIVWLVRHNRRLEVLLLKWNFSLFKSLTRGTMVVDLIRWALRSRIDFKFDAAHPIGCSHHQKIVVIDDVFAACGGIDMTSDRWDTPEHLPGDPRRKLPGTGGLYGPWHDLTMVMEGEIAAVLGELGRDRWEVAGGSELPPCAPQQQTPWPDELEAQFEKRRDRHRPHPRRLSRLPASVRDRGPVRRSDPPGAPVRLCRDAVFRLASHRRGDPGAAGTARLPGILHH